MGVEAEALAASGGFDGDDVAGVFGDDVGDDEINFVLGVNAATSPATMGGYLIDTALGGTRGLYLHAPPAAIPTDDEVEAVAVSIGLGDAEAQTCRLVRECHLGQLSLTFAGVDAAFVVGNGGGPGTFARLFHGRTKKASAV